MCKTAIVFHPDYFVGFNKTQLIERHLYTSRFIGSRFPTASSYTAGTAYRQYIPKQKSILRYSYSILRIHVLAVGQWLSTEHSRVMERANLVVVEGDSFIYSKAHCLKFCNFLTQITGDSYRVEILPEIKCLGVREQQIMYKVDKSIVDPL